MTALSGSSGSSVGSGSSGKYVNDGNSTTHTKDNLPSGTSPSPTPLTLVDFTIASRLSNAILSEFYGVDDLNYDNVLPTAYKFNIKDVGDNGDDSGVDGDNDGGINDDKNNNNTKIEKLENDKVKILEISFDEETVNVKQESWKGNAFEVGSRAFYPLFLSFFTT